MERKCENCKWWKRANGENDGSCLRYPPTILWPQFMILNALEEKTIESGIPFINDETEEIDKIPTADVGIWPITNASNWCGEFKKANRVPRYPSPPPPPKRNNLLNVCKNAVNEFAECLQRLPVGNINQSSVTKITAIMSKIQHAINQEKIS